MRAAVLLFFPLLVYAQTNFVSSSSYESNIKDMEDSLLDIEEAFVTVSTRDVVFDGKNLKKDDFFSTINDKIYETHTSPEKVSIITSNFQSITRADLSTLPAKEVYDKIHSQLQI